MKGYFNIINIIEDDIYTIGHKIYVSTDKTLLEPLPERDIEKVDKVLLSWDKEYVDGEDCCMRTKDNINFEEFKQLVQELKNLGYEHSKWLMFEYEEPIYWEV